MLLSSYEHIGHKTVEKFTEVAVTVDLEAVRHDLAGQTVTAEQRLHAVSYLHLQTIYTLAC